MKQIYPINKDTVNTVSSINDKPITQQQYDDLVERTNEAECKAQIASDKVDSLRNDISEGVITSCIQSDNATITSLDSDNIAVTNLIADGADITSLDSVCARIDTLNIPDTLSVKHTVGEDASFSGTVCASCFDGNSISVTNADITNLTTTCFSPNCITTGDIDAEGVIADSIDADTAYICTAHICKSNTECSEITDASITNANITNLTSTNNDLEFITHKTNAQEINATGENGDYYILLPLFTNGNYYLEAGNDGGTKLYSVELSNSLKNIQFRWSTSLLAYLKDVKLVTDSSGVTIVQIHANTNLEHITLYHQSQSTDNIQPPVIYSTDQLPEAEYTFEITQKAGTWIQDIIFTNKIHVDCLEMDQLNMDCVGIYKKLFLTCDYDEGIMPITTSGEENQYVSNAYVCEQLVPHWTSPTDNCEPVSLCKNVTNLVTERTVANWNGKAVTERTFNTPQLVSRTCIKTGDYIILNDNTVFVTCVTNPDDNNTVITYQDNNGCIRTVCSCYSGRICKYTNVSELQASYPITHIGNASCVHGTLNADTLCASYTNTCTFESGHIGDGCNIQKGLYISAPTEWTPVFGLCGDWYTYETCHYFNGYYLKCLSKVTSPINEVCVLATCQYVNNLDTLSTTYLCSKTSSFTDLSTSNVISNLFAINPGKTYNTNNPNGRTYFKVENDIITPLFCDRNTNWPDVCSNNFCYCAEKNSNNRAIVCFCSGKIKIGDTVIYRKDNTTCNEMAVYGTVEDGKVAVYNSTTNAIDTTEQVTLDNIVTNCLTVNCDAHIKGDLRVDGTMYVVDEESITSSSDILTLRANKDVTLASDKAGILINKYDGCHSLALVTDCDGVLRVGDGNTTDTTYTDLYLHNNLYYTDSAFTTQVTPSGVMTKWDDYEITDDYKYWKNAVFSVITFPSLQPLLTRDEAVNLTDLGLLKWNSATNCADTITVPSECGASLKYNTCTCSYYWEKSAGNYLFSSMACYTAVASTIPVGSLINIEDETNYVNAEEQI